MRTRSSKHLFQQFLPFFLQTWTNYRNTADYRIYNHLEGNHLSAPKFSVKRKIATEKLNRKVFNIWSKAENLCNFKVLKGYCRPTDYGKYFFSNFPLQMSPNIPVIWTKSQRLYRGKYNKHFREEVGFLQRRWITADFATRYQDIEIVIPLKFWIS